MKEPIHEYADIGLIHFMAYPETIKGEGPIYETVKKIVEDPYFKAIEITWMKNKKERNKVGKLLKNSGMRVAYGAQPSILLGKLNPNSLHKKERKKAIKTLKEQVLSAYEMGAEGMAFLSGKNLIEEERWKKVRDSIREFYDFGTQELNEALWHLDNSVRGNQLDELVNTTREICDYAWGFGHLKIVLEVFDSWVDKKCLVGRVESAAYLAKNVDRNNFGLMVDLSHLPLLGETPKQAILPIKNYLVHAHLGNCVLNEKSPAYGDQHPRFNIPDGKNGVEEITEFLRVLKSIDFLNKKKKPIVSFEVKPMPEETTEEVVEEAKNYLNKAWEKV